MSSKTSLNYLKVAIVYLLLVGAWGAIQTRGPISDFLNDLGPFREIITGALSYVNTIGWISMVGIGAIYYLVPHIMDKKASSEKWGKVSLALLNISIIGYVGSMIASGYLGGRLYLDAYNKGIDASTAYFDALHAVDPLFISATLFAYVTVISFFIFAYDIYKISTSKQHLVNR